MKNRKAAIIYLGLGTLLFALAPPVLKLLTTMGARLGLGMPKAISFCNVLFVGNACAGLVTFAFYGGRSIFGELIRLSRKTKIFLVLAALVSTVYPALLFTGLERTSVINVVLLSRFNGIVFVILAFLFLGATVRRSEVVGYVVMSVGVVSLLIANNDGLKIRSGELFVLLSTIFFALTEIISKNVLHECSVHTYVFFRNIVSSLVFFTVAVKLFGFEHFAEAFSGELWVLMLVYAGIAVVTAQVLWLKATRVLQAQIVANFQLLNPAFSLAFAYLLLNEIPGLVEWIVIAIIVLGISIPKFVGGHHAGAARMVMSVDTSLVGR